MRNPLHTKNIPVTVLKKKKSKALHLILLIYYIILNYLVVIELENIVV